MSPLAIASGITEAQNAFVESLSRGESLRLRRERAGLTQPQMAVAADIGVETVVNIEKDRNVQTVKLEAYEKALAAHERRVSLPPVPPNPIRTIDTVVTYRDHPASTNRENVPKGGGEDDPATTRIRELEARIARQDTQIQELRDMYKRLARTAIKRAESRKAPSTKTRRGGSDR